jgi:hypothetical protein
VNWQRCKRLAEQPILLEKHGHFLPTFDVNRDIAVHRHAVQLSMLALMLRGKEFARRTTSATPQQLTQSGQTYY